MLSGEGQSLLRTAAAARTPLALEADETTSKEVLDLIRDEKNTPWGRCFRLVGLWASVRTAATTAPLATVRAFECQQLGLAGS